MKNIDLGAKAQVWRHWLNHFESTIKVTQLIEQAKVSLETRLKSASVEL